MAGTFLRYLQDPRTSFGFMRRDERGTGFHIIIWIEFGSGESDGYRALRFNISKGYYDQDQRSNALEALR
ncbi:hypothetical protein NPIL_354301, partial [Nephila pilipes]